MLNNKGKTMSDNCHLDDIAYINKILSDSLTVASGHTVETMKFYSSKINDFNEDIQEGVLLIFNNEELIKIEYCNHIKSSIKKFISNNNDIDNIGIGVIYDIKDVYSQEKALKMIENYLSLIFKI